MASNLIIHDYAESAYLQYAMTTVKGRALARGQDGLKPVHRRILFAMKSLGLTPTSKPVKSARIIGDVLGKYHPHGDQSVYDAMTRMAQPFSLRYPLIDGQGNFGTRDGDAAAAMRYTEARLSIYADLLLSELDKNTVEFVPNYDATTKEPWLTPARLPMLLLNGTSGIAVGMAAEIPSHNLAEVAEAAIALLKNPNLTTSELLDFIKGPDFPEGGHVINSPQELLNIYESGRGPIKLRARWKKEELARGQWQIIIYEFPYQKGAKHILEEIEELTNPKPPLGKKTITQQQALLKQTALDLLDTVSDESDSANPIRLVISPASSKLDPQTVVNFLFENTSLEDSYSCNFTLVGLDGNPRTKNLKEILTEWITFRKQVVLNRLNWELKVAKDRLHILEGRHTAFLNVDQVVKIIREAQDPKQDLMDKLGLSEIQSEDILEMKLRQLNNLEGIKLEKDMDALRKEIKRLVPIIESDTKLKNFVSEELAADKDKFADNRRTLMESVDKQAAVYKPVLKSEPLQVVLSKNLWIKGYKPGADYSFKQGDSFLSCADSTTTDHILAISSKGRLFTIPTGSIPQGRGDGAPVSSLVTLEAGDQIEYIIGHHPDGTKILFSTSEGLGFMAPFEKLSTKQKAGKAFMTVPSGAKVLQPVVMNDGYVLAGSAEGKMLIFKTSEIKELPNGGKGVVLMNCSELVTLKTVVDLPSQLSFTKKDGSVMLKEFTAKELNKFIASRASKGSFGPEKAVFTNTLLESDKKDVQ